MKIAFLTAIGAAALIAQAANAERTPGGGNVELSCPQGCAFEQDFEGTLIDYTLPPTGRERWTFRLASEDPLAFFEVGGPSVDEIFSLVTQRTQTGEFDTYRDSSSDIDFTFEKKVRPLLTTIDVAVQPSFDNCSSQTPINTICARRYFVFANSTIWTVRSKTAYTLFTSYELVPEPQSWTMLIAGFGLVGSLCRGRRRAVAAQA